MGRRLVRKIVETEYLVDDDEREQQLDEAEDHPEREPEPSPPESDDEE